MLGIIFLFSSLQALAAPWGDNKISPYTFGSGCSSQGSWTQAALSQTQDILATIDRLKENPACKGIESVAQNLKIAQSTLALPKGQEGRAERLEAIPGEIRALTTYLLSNPQQKESLTRLLLGSTIDGATLALDSTAAATTIANPAAAAAEIAAASLETRLQRATLTGLDLVDGIFKVLPSFDECLIGRPDQGAALIGASVKLAAAVAGSGDGAISRLGTVMSNLVTLLRDRRFSAIRAKLDESQFWASMSCILDFLQAYCSAQDAYDLLYYSAREMRTAREARAQGLQNENPLAGYYLLVREVPIIAEWLQKVQFGTTPKLSTDARFKNGVWDNIVALEKSINDLRGTYNEDVLMVSTLADKEARKNKVLSIIVDLYNLMFDKQEGSENFFSLSVNRSLMPWYLIGRDKIPDQLIPRDGNMNITIEFPTFMRNGNNGGFLTEFDDPDLLASRVEKRLESVIEQAETKASAYFRQRLIVDMPNLVSEAVTDENLTVVTSLRHVYDYLEALRQKVLNSPAGDVAIIPSITDTQSRIKKTLDAFQAVRELARQQIAAGNAAPGDAAAKLSAQIQEGYKDVIQVAFDQFNVLLQRDTLLTVRLNTFVREDYSIRVRARENMSEYDRKVLIVAGKNLLDKLVDVQRLNPADAEIDLRQAQVINKRNIEGIEELFGTSLYHAIEGLGQVASRKPVLPPRSAGEDPLPRSADLGLTVALPGDGVASAPREPETISRRNKVPWWKLWRRHYDPVPLPADDKYGSFEQLKAKFCIQTLAFEDRARFLDLCQGEVLRSVFDDPRDLPTSEQRLSSSYDSYRRQYPFTRPTPGESICAFRDFGRRNLVYWLTKNLDDRE